MAFYHTYRSQTFDTVVGQPHIMQTLRNSLLQDKVSHAYLFSGPRGVGKTSTARILAKALNCLNRAPDSAEPCNACANCEAITQGKAMDLLEIDAASNRGIDEIRSLKEKVHYAPTQLHYKVYIIDEVHMLTNEAFNALLKTLEEPPTHTLFILATTEAYRVPDTVISRCIRFDFRRIPTSAITEHLQGIADKEGITVEKSALHLIAKQSQGGLRDAISVFEQMYSYAGSVLLADVQALLGVTDVGAVERLLDAIAGRDGNAVILGIQDMVTQGHDLNQVTDLLIEYLRQLLVYLATNDAALVDYSPDQEDKAAAYGKQFSTPQLLQCSELFLKVKELARYSPIPELPLELACLEAIQLLDGNFSSAAPQSSQKSPTLAPPQRRSNADVSTGDSQNPNPAQRRSNADVSTGDSQNPNPAQRRSNADVSTGTGSQTKPPPQSSHPPSQSSGTAAVSTGLSLNAVQNAWTTVLNLVGKQHQTLEALLRSFSPVGVSGNVLTLAVKYAFHRDKVGEMENKRLAEDAFSQALGTQVVLKLEQNSETTPFASKTQQTHTVGHQASLARDHSPSYGAAEAETEAEPKKATQQPTLMPQTTTTNINENTSTAQKPLPTPIAQSPANTQGDDDAVQKVITLFGYSDEQTLRDTMSTEKKDPSSSAPSVKGNKKKSASSSKKPRTPEDEAKLQEVLELFPGAEVVG